MTNTSVVQGRPASYHHGDLRRALIEAAVTIVNEEGDFSFTLRELARRAGVSHAAPYNHFPDRAALLAEVAARGFDDLRTALARLGDGGSPHGRLIALGEAYVRFGLERPGRYRLMFGPEIAESKRTHAGLREACDRAYGVLLEALDRGRAAGVVRVGDEASQAMTVWALVHGLTSLLIDQRADITGVDAEWAAGDAVAILLVGLCPEGTA